MCRLGDGARLPILTNESPSRSSLSPELTRRIAALARPHPMRNAWVLLKEWTFIFGAMWVCLRTDHPLVYALGLLWIGRRQFALAVLAHDGVHGTLFPDRRTNDLLGNWLCALPLHFRLQQYRLIHVLHHRWAGSDQDPDRWKLSRDIPGRSRGRLWAFLLMAGSGLIVLTPGFWHSVRALSALSRTSDRAIPLRKRVLSRLEQPCYQVAVLGFVWWTDLWTPYLLLWVLPMVTVLLFLSQFNGLGEHYGTEQTNPYNSSRTTFPRSLEWMLTAYNVHYHLDHHLYPAVPWYRLPALHRLLSKHDPAFAPHAHITRGYFGRGLIRELTRQT